MTLQELAKALGAEFTGDRGDAEVLGVSGLDTAAPGRVTYVEDRRRLAEAEAGPALALIVSPQVADSPKALLRVANPRLAYARALALFVPDRSLPPGIHPTAQIGADVEIGEGAAVGPYCVIGDGARIGARAQLHPLVTLGPGAAVGEASVIYPNVAVYHEVVIGARVVIHAGSVIGSEGFGYAHDGEEHVHIPHAGTVVVEDDVEIGANVTIDRGTTGPTVVGRGTKIDNLVQIAHNVKIGRHCLLAGQVGLAGSATLGDGVVLGGQAGVSDHIVVGEGAAAGARAGLVTDIPSGAVVIGMPARPRAEQLRIEAAARRLPDLLRTVRELSRRVAELEGRLKKSAG